MSGSTSPVVTYLAVDDANFRKALADAAALLQGYVRTNETAARAIAGANTQTDRAVSGMRNYGQAVGQAGFQIQDFAVQVQAGTSALTALSQQGSQLLGVFGTGGAIAGAALTVGILAAQLIGLSGTAETLTQIIQRQEQAYKDIQRAAEAWHGGMVQEQADLLKLQAYYDSVTESVRRFEAARLAAARAELGRQALEVTGRIAAPGSGILQNQQGEVPQVDAMGNVTGFLTGAPSRDPRTAAFSEALRVFRETPLDQLSTESIADLSNRMRALTTGSDNIAARARETLQAIEKSAGDITQIARARELLTGQQEALDGRLVPLPPGEMPPMSVERSRARAAASPRGEQEVMRAREALTLARQLAEAESPREALLARQRAEIEQATVSLRAQAAAETDPAKRQALQEQVRLITEAKQQALGLEETTRNRNALFQQGQALEVQRVRVQGFGMARGDAAQLLAVTQERQRIVNDGLDPKSDEALQRMANAADLAFGNDRLQQVQDFQSAVSGVGSAFSSAADDLFTGAKKIGDIFANLERQILRMLTNMLIMKPLERGFASIVGMLAPTTGGGAGGIEGLLTRGGSSLMGMLGVGGAGSFTKGVGDFTSEIVDAGLGALKAFAVGGGVMPNEAYIVGERGPEIFMPHTAGQIIPNARPSMGGSDGGVTVNVWGAQDFDSFRQSSAQISSAMARGVMRARRVA